MSIGKTIGLAVVAIGLLLSGIVLNLGYADNPADVTIPLVGLNAFHQAVVRDVPVGDYENSLVSALSTVQSSMAPVLEKHDSSPAAGQLWRIRTVGVGVGLTGTIGLGPIFSVTATPRLILVFTNSLNPVYPD